MIKQVLKRIPVANALNSWNKCRVVKRIYKTTVAKYAAQVALPEISVPSLQRKRPLNIFFMGTDEQQDRSGTLQALDGAGKLSWFTRADGSYGQNHPGSQEQRSSTNTLRLKQLFEEMAIRGDVPDILIAQTWASFIDPTLFSYLRESYGTMVVNIAMDDRHQYWGDKAQGRWGGTYGLIPHIDLALTAAPECVDWYLKEGCPALFFPEASDPGIFHPMPELPKIHDVSFVGGRYGIREKIVMALRKAGIKVSAYGSGWEGGRLPTENVPKLFAQSKIVLGVGTIGHCTDFYALKMRDFDGPMSGSFYLTHDNQDLHTLFKVGSEIETYGNIDECVEKAKWYLAHDSEREAVAGAGRLRAAKDHTWEKRFGDLFSRLHLEKNIGKFSPGGV